MKLIATLIPRMYERRTARSLMWREGYQVKTPSGALLFPVVTKREAKRYCKSEGWATMIGEPWRREGKPD